MQLFSFFSSSTAFRVRIALALKGVAYEYQAVNLRAGEQHQQAFLDHNPSGGVPALIMGISASANHWPFSITLIAAIRSPG